MTVKLGMKENDEFIQEVIQDMTQMKEHCTSFLKNLESKLDNMKKASRGVTVSYDTSKKNKQKKANITKAKKLQTSMS